MMLGNDVGFEKVLRGTPSRDEIRHYKSTFLWLCRMSSNGFLKIGRGGSC